MGIEPTTSSMRMRRSTEELPAQDILPAVLSRLVARNVVVTRLASHKLPLV